ncbi:hypothetical protein ACFB49_16860 [Sphingomonas sp. DBB INV C78]
MLMGLLWIGAAAIGMNATAGAASQGSAQVAQPRIIVQNGHAAAISALTWTRDGKFVLTGSTDGQLLIWDLGGNIVDRIQLGNQRERTVVERISVNADGRGAEVVELKFEDMFDNGVGSVLHRRTYSVRFGDAVASQVSDEQVDPPWAAGTSFLDGSLATKRALFMRADWPRSSLGWTIERRGEALAIRPPDAGARSVNLVGALGPAPDEGDKRLEAKARRIEQKARDLDRAQEISTANDEACRTQQKQCRSADELNALFKSSAASGSVEIDGTHPPLFAPGGMRIAWLDTGAGAGATLHSLDLGTGAAPPAVKLGTLSPAKLRGWTSPTILAVDDKRLADTDTGHVSTVTAQPCPLEMSGDLGAAGNPDCSQHAAEAAAAKGEYGVRLEGGPVVQAYDRQSGKYLCTAVIDEGEEVASARSLASYDGRVIALQSALGYTELFAITDTILRAPPIDCDQLRTRRGYSATLQCDANAAALHARKCPTKGAFAADLGHVGFHPTKPLLWIEGRGGTIDFHRILPNLDEPATPFFSLYRLPGDRFFAIDAKGRYDTNLAADTRAVRWVLSDAPFQSLAPQTFMRDYYQPGLTRRLLACAGAEPTSCDAAFPAIRPLAGINRVLPQVRIVKVRPGETPRTAIVSVEIADGIDPTAANGKTRSGVYDVRLFRNDRLMLHNPDQVYRDIDQRQKQFDAFPDTPDGAARRFEFMKSQPVLGERRPEAVAEIASKDVDGWRRLSRVEPDAKGHYPLLDFVVDLPTAAGTENSRFSAYAFNEDRVKSDTATFEYRRPPVPPQPRRAFIVTIGIDAYDAPRLALQFAASDATLLGERLGTIPDFEVRRITLAGTKLPDGKTRRVTRDAIEILLSALAGGDASTSAEYLSQLGFDASSLDRVRPDDIVIISFSGHGWADPQGNFYLLPADAKWPEGELAPDVSTLLSSANLSLYLDAIPAAEIALIIDACHSAASVDAGNFKPGPMGDAGLGQLAFDKGIRILAATQTDDVALEDPVLRQGLLTYALASEGITATGGKADRNGDGRITVDEWFAYAAKRLPSLSADARLGRLTTDTSGARGWARANAGSAKPMVQEPALFDFNAGGSNILLRDNVRP